MTYEEIFLLVFCGIVLFFMFSSLPKKWEKKWGIWIQKKAERETQKNEQQMSAKIEQYASVLGMFFVVVIKLTVLFVGIYFYLKFIKTYGFFQTFIVTIGLLILYQLEKISNQLAELSHSNLNEIENED